MQKNIDIIDFNEVKQFCLKNGVYETNENNKKEYSYSARINHIEFLYKVTATKNEYVIIKDLKIIGSRFKQGVFSLNFSVKKNKIVNRKVQYENAQAVDYDFSVVNQTYKNILLNKKLESKLLEKQKEKTRKI